jgi:hypothetical protein
VGLSDCSVEAVMAVSDLDRAKALPRAAAGVVLEPQRPVAPTAGNRQLIPVRPIGQIPVRFALQLVADRLPVRAVAVLHRLLEHPRDSRPSARSNVFERRVRSPGSSRPGTAGAAPVA